MLVLHTGDNLQFFDISNFTEKIETYCSTAGYLHGSRGKIAKVKIKIEAKDRAQKGKRIFW